MTAKYTFAVCISCGVQSQPIILLDGQPLEIDVALRSMGWRFDKLRFNIAATCPKCLKDAQTEKANAPTMDGMLPGVSGRHDHFE